MFGANQRNLIERLADHATAIAGLDRDAIRQHARTREYTWTRYAVMSEARRRGCSYPAIAKVMGFDHTTIIHGVRRADEIASFDTDMVDLLAALRAVQ